MLYLTAENDPNKVLRPRAEAMGADLDRLYFQDGASSVSYTHLDVYKRQAPLSAKARRCGQRARSPAGELSRSD